MVYEQYAGVHGQTRREIGILMACIPLWFAVIIYLQMEAPLQGLG